MGECHLLATQEDMRFLILLCLAFSTVCGERVLYISTHTASCSKCGMVEKFGYLTAKVCGSTNCCLSRSMDNDNVNWIPGQTDTFLGPGILECDNFEIGKPPFTVTLYHDGTDGITIDWVKVNTDKGVSQCSGYPKLDGHQFHKANCYTI